MQPMNTITTCAFLGILLQLSGIRKGNQVIDTIGMIIYIIAMSLDLYALAKGENHEKK